ncbi:hypothetical protein HJFPF1_03112 [Paramyrothecium foliicola]|nr:hypothetical protein HJFPF1_03112 [Paramyrothecium foliicola]
MAAAYGPEPAADASNMNLPAHLSDPYDAPTDASSVPRTQDAHLPPPNPHFVFPARLDSTPSLPPQPRAAARRPMSAIEPQHKLPSLNAENAERPRRAGSVALPDFSFNPGASLPPTPGHPLLLSPPTSPYSPKNDLPSPARPAGHGHRRGGSEFVGGRLREGNSIAVMSTSPTRSESGFASPTFQPPKRGHRRGMSSAAISINDLPNLSPPFDRSMMKGSSAPTSPTNFEHTMETLNIQADSPRASEFRFPMEPVDEPTPVETPSPTESQGQAQKPPRARVGFSDTLEFIPRPLSMVSSDTSSVATARPGHSVSGSISSIVSAASPSGRESPAPLSRSPTKDLNESRPSTAGAILERTQEPAVVGSQTASPRRRNSIPALLDVTEASAVTPTTPSPSKSFKRWSFFGLESFSAAGSPTKVRPSSSSSSSSTPRAVSIGSSSEHGSESAMDGTDDGHSKAKAKKQKKKNKKTKSKSKGWTGSILPRKSKSQKCYNDVADRPPTPPAPALSLEDDEDKTEASSLHSPVATTPTVTITASATPPRDSEGTKRRVEEGTLSMIDLDAALGPFNTPLPHNPEWEAAQRAAGNVGKRRLHSAQGLKGFSGPGMHYHRRAESAPDLPPFDAGRSALHRFGSSSTMADVFEEDEEDDESAAAAKTKRVAYHDESDDQSDGDVTPPAALHKEFIIDNQDTPLAVRRQASSLSDKDQSSTPSIRGERSRTSLQERTIAEEPASLARVSLSHGNAEPADHSMVPLAKQDSSSADSGLVHCNPASIPISPYSMSHASSFPSPRSPISIDAQRISTAPSSIADETNFQSLLMGEPGPEVRLSVDYDIPSLTSSNSTMTRDSAYTPNLRMPRPALRDQRPVSVSSAFGRRRSSLASLSRLISSSHGERSKLSMEVPMDDDTERTKSKTSRTKRLSKLMQFWKSNKEGAPS